MATRRRELIDDPAVPEADLRANLRDQVRLGRLLGLQRSLVALARPVLAGGGDETVRILDAGCGGGDLARRLAAQARSRSRKVEVVALDRSAPVLRAARAWTPGEAPLRFVRGDLEDPPFPAVHAPFDLTLCVHVLHHLDPARVAPALAALAAVTRGRLVVADLRRSTLAALAFPLLARVLGLHPMSRHDGLLSLRQALTAEQLENAARAAGLGPCRPRRRGFWLELVWDRSAGEDPRRRPRASG